MNERIKLDPAVWQQVTRGGCVMCRAFPVYDGDRRARAHEIRRRQWHHVLSQQLLRREGLGELVNDISGGICLCEYHHRRHENHVQRVPQRLLPAQTIEWARAWGLEWAIDREYQ